MSRAMSHPMRVRFAECDPQGIVFNSRYLEYFDVAMTEIWREALGPYEQATADAGVDLVVAEAGIRYRDSLRFDDLFDLRASVRRIGTTSMITAIAVVRDDMPDTVAGFSKKEKRAKLLYIKSQYRHMPMVTNGKVIPLLLRITPLKAL